ncbi:MFS transporter [Novosphingopyxis baekryungensis]|uniref:MFS transporter n=1 Tax=Novosphingopyxis baekryungensis TaxID=279369 RepID=UPI0003B74D02|nr:MFS transporter [Novosphingopyxis baekryungensis]
MPDAPVQEPPKHMQLANPDAIPTSRMTVLFMVMLISAAGNTAMQSVLPAIGTQLGVADYWISAAFTWSALLWVITAPRWARLSDRRGRKALMTLGVTAFSISMLCCGLVLFAGLNGLMSGAVTLIVFALFRSIFGAFGSAAPPAVQAYVAARTDREQRTKSLSLIASSFGLGTIIGPFLAPFFILPIVDDAGPMLVFALIGFVVIIALRLKLPTDDPRFSTQSFASSEPFASAAPSSIAADPDGTVERTRLQWLDPRVRNWLAVGLVGGHAQAILSFVAGFLVLDRLGLRATPAEAYEPTALVLTVGAAATLIAQWGIIPMLRMGPRKCILFGMVFIAGGALMMGAADSLYHIAAGFGIASLGFALFRPGFTAGASLAVAPEDQGAVAGMVASINGAAFILGPSFGVFIYNQNSWSVFILAASIAAVVFLWGFFTLTVETGEA